MKFTILLEPVTKKNSQQIIYKKVKDGNRIKQVPIIIPSQKYKDYEKKAVQLLLFCTDHIDYPVNIEAHFYMGSKRRCDLTNLLEALDDVLVKAGVIEDDNYNIIAGHDGSRVHYDKDNPRTEFIITQMGV